MLSCYYTVKSDKEHEKMIEKSRFIAYIHRTESEKNAKQFIEKIKKMHNRANHHCSAYTIGDFDDIQKANDDGEPSGTAGVPMLDVLKKRQLKNTVVVVTRYFGGIKLGIGGLIRAYRQTTQEGLNAAGIVEKKLMHLIKVKVDYTWLGKLENELRDAEYKIKKIHYLDKVTFDTYIPEGQTEVFNTWIKNVTNGQVSFEQGGIVYLEESVEH